MGNVGLSVIIGLSVGVVAAVLAVILNWFQRPRWATTGRLIFVVIVCIVLGALIPLLLLRPPVSVQDVAGSWKYSSSVSAITADVDLIIREDSSFDFTMAVNVSNPPLTGNSYAECRGIASPDGDSVALRATSGSCPGLTVKPGPTSQTLELARSNYEPMTLVRSD
jgi:hypothetical protein